MTLELTLLFRGIFEFMKKYNVDVRLDILFFKKCDNKTIHKNVNFQSMLIYNIRMNGKK